MATFSNPVLAANDWPTNAELIEDCAKLGYLTMDSVTLDPTYGKGVWWNNWRPRMLYRHDIKMDGVDFRTLPYTDSFFDAIAYDPPYVCKGGRRTTTMPEFQEGYGLTDAPKTPALLQELINDGLTEMARVIKPRGYILVKCQDYVSSGKLWIGTHWTLTHGLDLGLELVDRMERVGAVRPQPERKRQVHARRNLSTLFVFRAPRVKTSRVPLAQLLGLDDPSVSDLAGLVPGPDLTSPQQRLGR